MNEDHLHGTAPQAAGSRQTGRGLAALKLGGLLLTAGMLAAACGPEATPGATVGSTPAPKASCAATTLSAACDTQTPAASLTGAGANSINTFFSRAFADYHTANSSVAVNYAPSGSSVGISDMQSNTVAFGDTEIPMPVPATGTAGTILQIPVDLGGVALSYNVPGVPQGLKLDGPTVAGIFLGTIANWDAPAIKNLNPAINLPHLAIVPVHRADKSGPGYSLEQYLIDAGGSAWTSKVGTKPSTSWPAPIASVGLGEQLNTGVAGYIGQTSGAIGYVEYAYAAEARFTNAALKNPAGQFVAPSVSSIAAAGASATGLSATNFNIVDGTGSTTYPLANFSWTLIYQKQAQANTGIALGRLFDWVTTTEQAQAAGLGYSPLPANATILAHQTLLSLQDSSGRPLFS